LEEGHDVNGIDEQSRTPLFLACKYGNLEVADYLIQHGASIEQRDETGRTPLYNAIYSGSHEVVALLLKSGAKTDIVDALGNSPVEYAKMAFKPGMISALQGHHEKHEE